MIYKKNLCLDKLHTRFLYSQFECSGNTFLAINSELLADAVRQTWPSAMGRRAIFLQKNFERRKLKIHACYLRIYFKR